MWPMLARSLVTAALLVAQLRLVTSSACSGQGSCQTCIGNAYCGWCSPNGVVYKNGTVGARCADQRENTNGWDCPSLYQTASCVEGYVCDKATNSCTTVTTANAGTGTTIKQCLASCGAHKTASPSPPKIYACDSTTYKCVNVSAGTHGGASEQVCNKTCAKPLAKDGTPPELLGVWRAIQVQLNFTAGEFDFSFPKNPPNVVRISNPAGKITLGTVQSFTPIIGPKQVWFHITDSDNEAGSYIKAIYGSPASGPETTVMRFAFGAPAKSAEAAIAPGDFDMKLSMTQLYLGLKCLRSSDCAFAFDAGGANRRRLFGGDDQTTKLPAAKDACNAYTSCDTCLVHNSKCGWCTTPVAYTDFSNPIRAQCSGFDKDGNPKPAWTCGSSYEHSSCKQFACDPLKGICREAGVGEPGVPYSVCNSTCKPAEKIYACKNISGGYHCEVVPAGTDGGISRGNCNASCHKPKPVNKTFTCKNFQCVAASKQAGGIPEPACNKTCVKPKGKLGTPALLLGIWRGLRISSGYEYGELDVMFNATMAYFRSPALDFYAQVLTPTTSTGGHLGVLLAITTGPFAGKTISAIYLPSVGDGICVQMTLAMSAPGHAVPTSFKVAMTTTGMGVLYLAKCDSRGQAACDFSSVLEPGFHLSDRAVDPSCTSTDTVNEACGLTDLSTPNADMTCTATCARAYVPFYVKCAATFSEMGLRSSLDAFYQSCLAVEQPATPTASCKNTFPNADCLRLKGQFDSKGYSCFTTDVGKAISNPAYNGMTLASGCCATCGPPPSSATSTCKDKFPVAQCVRLQKQFQSSGYTCFDTDVGTALGNPEYNGMTLFDGCCATCGPKPKAVSYCVSAPTALSGDLGGAIGYACGKLSEQDFDCASQIPTKCTLNLEKKANYVFSTYFGYSMGTCNFNGAGTMSDITKPTPSCVNTNAK